MNTKRLLGTLLLIICATAINAQDLSPRDFGLDTASSDESRYQVLYNTHCAAIKQGVNVSYLGIDTLRIAIPAGAKSIPLTRHNNFNGVVMLVSNYTQNRAVFALSRESQSIQLTPAQVDNGDFSDVEQLQQGTYLVMLADKHPWVADRIGYNYPAMRNDILFVKDGHAINRPVAPYSTDSTQMQASFCPADTAITIVENLHFYRQPGATFKAYCISLSRQNNVLLRNIDIHTPKSKLTADAAISISSCTNITLQNIVIDQTYSGKGKYGYGLSMNNVWNSTFDHVTADGIWGVFGTNNLSSTTLIACDVNRFDIHCYGRDVTCRNCTFRQKQTQFSSFYGTLIFDSCQFADCIPVRIRSSFNAYTPFDIVMRHCTFQATLRHHALVNVMLLDSTANRRPELAEKCWPNLSIEDMTVEMAPLVRNFVLFDPTGTTSICKKQKFGYLSNISINGLRFSKSNPNLYLSSVKSKMKQPVTISIRNLSPAKIVRNLE